MAKTPPKPSRKHPAAGNARSNAQQLTARGFALHQKGQFKDAAALYERALNEWPDHLDALHLSGIVHSQLKQYGRAVEFIDRAIAIDPTAANAHSNRGIALRKLERLDEALASYDKAIALKPDLAEAHYNRSVALQALKRPDEALAGYDKAVALKPDYADAYSNRGNVLKELKRPAEAIASYNKTIALKPGHAEAHYNRGLALQGLGRLNEALASYDKAIALEPDYADAYLDRGNTLDELKRLDEAIASYDKAIALRPDYAEVHSNRGNTLVRLERLDDAIASYEKAIALKPDFEFLSGTLLHTRMRVCDWAGLEESLVRYEQDIRASKKVTGPFHALSLVDSPELHKKAAQIYGDAKYPGMSPPGGYERHPTNERIRIGYFSGDFRNHAISRLIAELLESHDRARFELFGFSFGPDTQDEMRKRVSSAFAKFYDIRSKSDQDVARSCRELGIDIAVDLGGYTGDPRTGIFAERCAPVQVNYLGYPGTMGTEYFDYVIADATVIPRERQSDYTEKVVYLPHSYQVNDSKRRISERVFSRQELGLPASGFVFCCFNNNYKIQPAVFDVWMRLLGAVKGSVLWLLEDHPSAAKNLRREAEKRGVDSARLVFAKRMSMEEHLARHRLADLFVDSLPYNAHTTASDALWAGLPVLTCVGKAFAGRVAAGLLKAVGLPELITESELEYEARAIELAESAERLSAIRQMLAHNRLSTPLFDTSLFTGHIEAAYTAMYERHQAGLAPESIEVG